MAMAFSNVYRTVRHSARKIQHFAARQNFGWCRPEIAAILEEDMDLAEAFLNTSSNMSTCPEDMGFQQAD